MRDFISRAMQVGLAKVGEPSSLQGVPCGNVNVQYDVSLSPGITTMSEDNYVARFTIATIDNRYSPAPEQLLVHPDGGFRLDRCVLDNGVTSQWVVVKV